MSGEERRHEVAANCGTWSGCSTDYSGRDLNDQRTMKDEVRWAGRLGRAAVNGQAVSARIGWGKDGASRLIPDSSFLRACPRTFLEAGVCARRRWNLPVSVEDNKKRPGIVTVSILAIGGIVKTSGRHRTGDDSMLVRGLA